MLEKVMNFWRSTHQMASSGSANTGSLRFWERGCPVWHFLPDLLPATILGVRGNRAAVEQEHDAEE
jgi:hypothetical protein